ncbi:MAG: hypothetical protein H0X33_14370 [Taibaiella sp.]|nr:hypothetical protein [Taibaiella sp.]
MDIEKPLDYEKYGIKGPVSRFILLDRFYDNRLNNLKEFPIEVHAFIPLSSENPEDGLSNWKELFNAAWVNIYDNYEDAAKHII